MKGDAIPPTDHVLRYAPKTKAEDPGTAFLLKEGEQALSINWMEAFSGQPLEQVEQVRAHIHMTIGANGKFFELNVGDALAHIALHAPAAAIVEDQTDAAPPKYANPDPSHALFHGLPASGTDEALIVGELLAEKVVVAHPGKKPQPSA